MAENIFSSSYPSSILPAPDDRGHLELQQAWHKYTNTQYSHLLRADCRVVRGHTHRTTHACVLKVCKTHPCMATEIDAARRLALTTAAVQLGYNLNSTLPDRHLGLRNEVIDSRIACIFFFDLAGGSDGGGVGLRHTYRRQSYKWYMSTCAYITCMSTVAMVRVYPESTICVAVGQGNDTP